MTFLDRFKSMDIDSWSAFMRPYWFFAGIIAGFAACCIGGWFCARIGTFGPLPRLNVHISPYSNYFPTANQLLRYVEDHARPQQIIVVVGGNSVFKGIGQTGEDLWSTRLQKSLGDRYFVVNYAMEGTGVFEGGYWVAEALLKRGRKVIFISDCEPTATGFTTGYLFTPLFFDFYNRGLFLPSVRRDKYLKQLWRDQAIGHSDRVLEVDLCKRIDSVVNASDLWHWISYNWFSTMWTEYTPSIFPARKTYQYANAVVPDFTPGKLEVFTRDMLENDEHFAIKDKHGKWVPAVDPWHSLEYEMAVAVPPERRANCVVFIARVNPYVTDRLTADQQACHLALFQISRAKWQENGYRVAVLGEDFSESDFYDLTHHSAYGGRKVAEIVAEQVHEVARKLGYE